MIVCICVSVCIYVCVYVWLCVCMFVYMYICVLTGCMCVFYKIDKYSTMYLRIKMYGIVK